MPLTQALIYWTLYVLVQSVLGYFLVKQKVHQAVAWVLPVLSVVLVHFLLFSAPPALRMVALIVLLLHAMKIVVANAHPAGRLPFNHWLVYYFVTVNMNPAVFATRSKGVSDYALLVKGGIHLFLGVGLVLLLRHVGGTTILVASTLPFWGYSLIGLVALSLILHFGVLPINTFLLKCLGYADYPVFKQPFLSKSIAEFWGRRWNLAFSEMTATAIFKPLAKKMGVVRAGFIAFMVSGLLHEIAISLSGMKGFGWPLLYFALHGLLMRVERMYFNKRKPGTLWVVFTLAAPMPLLFHEPFLREVVWKVILYPTAL